jgi:tRNA-dihydrouridine synthase A
LKVIDRKICIAPMLGWTDRHARYFFRQITRRAVVFTEMLAPEALLLGRREWYLQFHPDEHPIVFQLGGNHPATLAAASRVIEKEGYDEVNLNLGCPSANGKRQRFGAHLMKEPEVVADCLEAMAAAVSIPVSAKIRIGIDDADSFAHLVEFVAKLSGRGCKIFYVHARKALLEGLTCKENREIPPLRYDYVERLKREFPHLTIVLNGGITEWSEVPGHLEKVDGVMIGRRAYKDPYWLRTLDQDFFGSTAALPDHIAIMRRCIPYVEQELANGTALRDITRHMVALYRKLPASTAFRRHVNQEANRRGADIETYLKAIDIAAGLAHPRNAVLA